MLTHPKNEVNNLAIHQAGRAKDFVRLFLFGLWRLHFLSIHVETRMTSSQCGIQRLLRQGAAAATPAGGRKEEEEETMAPVVMDRRRLRGAFFF